VIDEEEINDIMADFPKPKDDDEIKRLIQQAGKDPDRKGLVQTPGPDINLAGPLTYLWSDLLSPRTKISTHASKLSYYSGECIPLEHSGETVAWTRKFTTS